MSNFMIRWFANRGTIPAAFVALAALSAPANADVTFSDFGPGDSYDTGGAYIVGTGTTNIGTTQGFQFTSSLDGALSSIDVVITHSSGSLDVTFTLYSDANNKLGSALESWNATAPGILGLQVPPVTLVSVLNPMLTAGTNYWLLASSDGFNGWNLNNTGGKGLRFTNSSRFNNAIFTDQTQAVFRVNVSAASAVPEPGVVPFAILASGSLIGLIARKRKTR